MKTRIEIISSDVTVHSGHDYHSVYGKRFPFNPHSNADRRLASRILPVSTAGPYSIPSYSRNAIRSKTRQRPSRFESVNSVFTIPHPWVRCWRGPPSRTERPPPWS